MGQDSWQAEQRRPYFRAKAGIAFAGWLPLKIRKIKTRAPVRTCFPHDGILCWQDCIPMCMPNSSGDFLFFTICFPTRPRGEFLRCAQDRNPFRPAKLWGENLNRFFSERSYHRTGAESYYGCAGIFKGVVKLFFTIFLQSKNG